VGELIFAGPGYPAAYAVVGRHDPGGSRVSRLRLVDLDLPGLPPSADLARREPQRRLAARLAGPYPAKRIGWDGDADPRRRRFLTAPPDAHGHLRARRPRGSHRSRRRSGPRAPGT